MKKTKILKTKKREIIFEKEVTITDPDKLKKYGAVFTSSLDLEKYIGKRVKLKLELIK